MDLGYLAFADLLHTEQSWRSGGSLPPSRGGWGTAPEKDPHLVPLPEGFAFGFMAVIIHCPRVSGLSASH